jgi:hypothetical protein
MAARRDSFAERQINRGPRAPKTAPPRISVFIRFAIDFALGSHSVRIRFAFGSVSVRVPPRLAQQGHDLAIALPPCQVDGRLAVLVSESHIGAAFEKALGDREVVADCRGMQS